MALSDKYQATITDGVESIDVGKRLIVVSGKVVDVAYGSEWQAWEVYREWLEAIRECPEVEEYAGVPVGEIPAQYWVN